MIYNLAVYLVSLFCLWITDAVFVGFYLHCGIDCIGHVVGKEDVRPMVTKSSQESKCMTLYWEDLYRKNKIKSTIFGETIGKLTLFVNKDDGELLILIAQLFKPNQYFNQIAVQNNLYASRVFLNSDFPDVVAFKNRYPIKEGDVGSQRINHTEIQPQYSVSDELSGVFFPINTIEEEGSTWVLASIVSVDVGTASCKSCPKKVVENCRKVGFNAPFRYRLNVIVIDETGCINIMLWNQEADIKDLMKDANENACPKAFEPIINRKFLFRLSISHKNLTFVDQAYNAIKISDDEVFIGLYSSHSSSIYIGVRVFVTKFGIHVVQGLSNVVPTIGNNDLDSDGNGVAIAFLSKDSGTENIFESGLDTPGKCVIADSAPSMGVSGLTNPEDQGSNNKTFRRGSTKRKIERFTKFGIYNGWQSIPYPQVPNSDQPIRIGLSTRSAAGRVGCGASLPMDRIGYGFRSKTLLRSLTIYEKDLTPPDH
ncbi:hypothetical protein Ahy_A04g021418 [Arachis hypogaea]|uniref:Replication protein A OB domain-containing protein n=1 Tax=Arachis hypogaea TaxID=3818 RepID=A0A445DKC8_ARAHY|nr:hypothetical protein Ahy_A04g021418 [Arachis hypogaea]